MAFLLGSFTEGLFSGAKNMASIMDEYETSKDKAKWREAAESDTKAKAERDAARKAAATPKSQGGAPVDTGAGPTSAPSGGVDPDEIDRVGKPKEQPTKPVEPPKTAMGAPESQVDSSLLPPGGTAQPSGIPASQADSSLLPPGGTAQPSGVPASQADATLLPPGGTAPSNYRPAAANTWEAALPGAGVLTDPNSAINRGLKAAGSAVAGALGFGGGNTPKFDPYRGAYNPKTPEGQRIEAQQTPPSSVLMPTETSPPPGTRPGLGVFPQRGATPSPTRPSSRPPQQPGVYITPGSLTGGQVSPAPATALPATPAPDMAYDPSTGTWIRRGQPPAMFPR